MRSVIDCKTILTKEFLAAELNASRTPYRIAKSLNISETTVRDYCDKHGLERQKRPKTTPLWDQRYFESIDNEHKAYWLGIILTRGSIVIGRGCKTPTGIIVSFPHDEEYHLARWHREINSNNNIATYQNGKLLYCRSQHFSRTMCGHLARYGCVPQKSVKLGMPFPQLGESLTRHFIRGYIDGHSSLSWNRGQPKLDIGGNFAFLDVMKHHIGLTSKTHQYKHSPAGSLRVGGKRKVRSVGDYIYQDATVFLERKRKWFDSLDSEFST
jgi:hypothetical protein